MTESSVVAVGVGMMTAVGLSATETAAAVRARTTRFVQSRLRDRRFESYTLAEVIEDGLPPLVESLTKMSGLSARAQRMLRLATMPLQESAKPIAESGIQPGLCLALPEADGVTTKPIEGSVFLRLLAVQAPSVFNASGSDASHVGRAGGLIAIGQAVLTIQRGLAEFMIAGGVDTYRDLWLLAQLDREQRVKSETSWDAFVPGEGAGFVLLCSARTAAARGLPVLSCVTPIAMGFEAGHLYSGDVYRGEGLASTFAQLVAQGLADAPIAEVYSSMTGESHWAKEWGVAFLRTKAAFREGHGMHHPADCFGDTGAASGPLMVGLAAVGIRDRYRGSPVLAYASSDRGSRAAVVLST